MDNVIISRSDYDSEDIVPQLLAVKSGARGSVYHLRTCFIGDFIADVDLKILHVPHGLIRGYQPEEYFTRTIGALKGLGAMVLFEFTKKNIEKREAYLPKGYSVLARAFRSSNPGTVFAQAAEKGEVDPLKDPDVRLFVGLKPL